MTQSAAQRYLRLGLQLGRHVEGIVDAYFGPPEPAAAVEAAPPVAPRNLVAAAVALLDELEDGWLCLHGDLRSRIAVNVDLPMSAIELLRLTIHETSPGHHAERCSKEHLLVRGRGLLEETVVLVPTPQSLVSEGIAELAPQVQRTRHATVTTGSSPRNTPVRSVSASSSAR